jgi:hypothetical protein
MRKPTIITLALTALLAAGVAGCGSAGPGSAGGASAPAERPLAVTWKIGGAYAGPVPPANPMPGPTGTWQLNPRHTNGYTFKDSITFGVPLHYAIPRVLIDCNTAYPDDVADLDPGQYVIPYSIHIKNLTPQQAGALAPEMTVTYDKPRGDGTTDSVRVQVTGDEGSNQTWADGSCTLDVGQRLEAGGSTTLNGFIGPATPDELSKGVVNLHWTLSMDGDQSLALHTLLPQQARAWLVTHGGSN